MKKLSVPDRALRDSNEKFTALMRNIDVGVALVDDRGCFEIVNPAFLRIFDLPGESDIKNVNDRDWSQWRVFEENGQLLDVDEHPVRKAAMTGTPVRARLVGMKPPSSESLTWLLISAETILRPDGRKALICVYQDITEQKEAEKARQAALERLSAVISVLYGSVLLMGEDQRVEYANTAFCTHFGLKESPQALAGLSASEMISRIRSSFRHPDREIGRITEILDQGQPVRAEEVAMADGRTLLRDFIPAASSQGQPRTRVWHHVDITDRKRMEDALRLSEEKFSLAFSSNPAAIALTRLEDGTFLEVNDTWVRLNGHSREQAIGRSARTMHIWPTAEAAERFVRELKARGSLSGWEQEFRTRSGESFVAELSAQVLTVRDEKLILSTLVDITDRKKAEAALTRANDELERRVGERTAELVRATDAIKTERQRLFDVLETLPAMICLLTPDYRVAFANRSFRDRFGESNGRHCYEYCWGYEQPCAFCESYRVLETGHPHHWEVKAADGCVIEAHDYPFTDVDGSSLVLEMDVDITQWRQTEKKLVEAHDELAQRAAQLRALAGEITLSEQRERRRVATLLHDHLQQLLVGAKYRVSALGRTDDERMRATLAETEQLLDDCIQASRSLTAELSPPILHDAGLARGLEWLARRMAESHGLTVELSMAEDIPPLAEDVKLLLFESIRELLFNTAKHARTRSANVTVHPVTGGELVISVSDAGCGFDPDAVKKAEATGGKFGLFSIHERIGMMGGRMEISSSEGSGTRVALAIPVSDQKEAVNASRDLRQPQGTAKVAARRASGQIRVLVADDHKIVREGFVLHIQAESDMEVVAEAADGQEAVEMARLHQPDVVIMDMSMPGMNGVEATRLITGEMPGIRVIGLSMYEKADGEEVMEKAGAVAYLTKDCPSADLIGTIRRIMSRP